MLARRTAPAVLGLALLLTWLAAAQAQHEEQSTNETDKKTKVAEPKETKASPELAKAQAEVERLRGQLKHLHEQWWDTAVQLRKAQAEVAKQGGYEDFHHGRLGHGGRPPHPWFGWAWSHHHHDGWHGGRHEDGKNASPELEQKVDRLQREVGQLQRELQEQKKK